MVNTLKVIPQCLHRKSIVFCSFISFQKIQQMQLRWRKTKNKELHKTRTAAKFLANNRKQTKLNEYRGEKKSPQISISLSLIIFGQRQMVTNQSKFKRRL